VTTIRVARTGVVEAPPERVYTILADYREGHPRILPRPAFSDLTIERGGIGPGTIIRFEMTALGATREIRAEVTSPEPGRMLVETDLLSGAVTTFQIDPLDGGRSSLTISTEWTANGITGLVQRLMAPSFLRKLYADELQNLAAFCSKSV
jgi:Polyketide cyclase / dehydrase and lipid transport